MPSTKKKVIKDNIISWIGYTKNSTSAYDMVSCIANTKAWLDYYVECSELEQGEEFTKDNVLKLFENNVPAQMMQDKLSTLNLNDIYNESFFQNIYTMIYFFPKDSIYKKCFLRFINNTIFILTKNISSCSEALKDDICKYLIPVCDDFYDEIEHCQLIDFFNKFQEFISQQYPFNNDDLFVQIDNLIELANQYNIESKKGLEVNWVQNILRKRKPILNPSERDLI